MTMLVEIASKKLFMVSLNCHFSNWNRMRWGLIERSTSNCNSKMAPFMKHRLEMYLFSELRACLLLFLLLFFGCFENNKKNNKNDEKAIFFRSIFPQRLHQLFAFLFNISLWNSTEWWSFVCRRGLGSKQPFVELSNMFSTKYLHLVWMLCWFVQNLNALRKCVRLLCVKHAAQV